MAKRQADIMQRHEQSAAGTVGGHAARQAQETLLLRLVVAVLHEGGEKRQRIAMGHRRATLRFVDQGELRPRPAGLFSRAHLMPGRFALDRGGLEDLNTGVRSRYVHDPGSRADR